MRTVIRTADEIAENVADMMIATEALEKAHAEIERLTAKISFLRGYTLGITQQAFIEGYVTGYNKAGAGPPFGDKTAHEFWLDSAIRKRLLEEK